MMKYLKSFLLFWYDFLVGDSMTLAVGGIFILALGYGLVRAGAGIEAEVLLPLVGVVTIYVSLPELRRRK
jgi:hypothetical protein